MTKFFGVHFLLCLFTLLAFKASSQTNEITKLKEENDYLKKSLNIRQAVLKQQSTDDFTFEILSCKGTKSEKKIRLEVLITNHAGDRTIQFSPDTYARAIDIQGNAYTPDDIRVGAEKYASAIFKDVPLKLVFSIVNVTPEVAMFKLVNLKYFVQGINVSKDLLFRDIPITWK